MKRKQITNSNFRAWFTVSRAMEHDEGHSLEFRDGWVILDGVAAMPNYGAARDLMVDPSPFRGVDGEVDPYLA